MSRPLYLSVIVSALFLLLAFPVLARTPAPEGVQAYIISPADGETVSSPVNIKFGLQGMGVAPAGIDKDKTGHHHLLIDVETPPAQDKPIPSDNQHKHFGGGQTEAWIELPPGKHTLQLLLGDKDHVPHQPPVMSRPISITVK